MPFSAEFEKYIWEGIIFLAYLFICGGLMERRFSKKISLLAGALTLAVIVMIQAALLGSGEDATLVLTLLPVTAYLPVVICLHILSKSSFFQTVAVWTVATAAYFLLNIFHKVLQQGLANGVSGPATEVWMLVGLLLLASLLVFISLRFLRRPFQRYVLQNSSGWTLLCLLVLLVYFLFSYFSNSTTDMTALLLLLVTGFLVFLLLVRLIVAAASIRQLQENRQAVDRQLALQRKEYEDLRARMELGREYRHDMRHHLSALEGLAKQADADQVIEYIENLNGRMAAVEEERYCANAPVNAVLATYLRQAKEAGCTVTADVHLPQVLPFDELDICIILANAMENAIHACGEISLQTERYVHVNVQLAEREKLVISLENPCEKAISFDASGLPQVPQRDGHGLGLRSIQTIVKKYDGLLQCRCADGVFQFRTVLFDRAQVPNPAPEEAKVVEKRPLTAKRVVVSALLCLVMVILFISGMPAVADNLENVPVLGAVVSALDIRTYTRHFGWGYTSMNIQVPVVRPSTPDPSAEEDDVSDSSRPEDDAADGQSDPEPIETSNAYTPEINIETPSLEELEEETTPTPTPETPASTPSADPQPSETPEASPDPEGDAPGDNGIDDLNQQMEAYVAELEAEFAWYVARRYNGYVGLDSTYTILRNDEQMLSIRFDAVINVGGSVELTRTFTLDKSTGRVLTLSDLFLVDSDYISVISAEIKAQMLQQIEAGTGDYILHYPGSIWSEAESFQAIDPDQGFYINDQSQLVIVFVEYEVAPGSMGAPEFVIPTEILSAILVQPSLLS